MGTQPCGSSAWEIREGYTEEGRKGCQGWGLTRIRGQPAEEGSRPNTYVERVVECTNVPLWRGSGGWGWLYSLGW